VLLIAMLALAQVTNPPEFEENTRFQTGTAATTVDGSSHVSAERAAVNQELVTILRKLPGHDEGVRLIEGQMPAAAQSFFETQRLKIGVAVTLFMAGKAEASAELLVKLANEKTPDPAVLAVLGETVGVAKPWSARMLAAIRKLNRPESADGEYYLARALLKQDPPQTAAALTHLERSAALDPRATRALLEMARQATAANQRAAAIAALEEALRRDERSPAAHYRLAQLYRAAGQAERGREHLKRFEELRNQP
jgi:tetratricopeptide (TPR) repeat protein